jgi:hypothetical protein
MSLAHALRANHLKFLLPSCLLQIKYACAMIETGTRHTILICSCTNPEKVADRKGYHTKRKQDSEAIFAPMTACSPFECPDCDPSEVGLQDISRQATCLARASQPKKKKRRKSKKAKGAVIAAPAEATAPDMAAVPPPRLVHPPQHRMHIDHAHSINLGVTRSSNI